MATENRVEGERTERIELDAQLRAGSHLMALAGVAFVGYGVVFLALAFFGDGFELGVHTLDGLSRAELAASNPQVAYYVTHLHVATAAFIVSTGIGVAALSWYGVRQRLAWAWATAIVAAVVGLGLALPMHWTAETFAHDWLTHLGPIYLATVAFLVGVALTYRGVRSS